MIHELAAFERAPEQCTVTESQITAALFGDDAVACCSLADVDGQTAAMALWFRNFSTWDGGLASTWKTSSSENGSGAAVWPGPCSPHWHARRREELQQAELGRAGLERRRHRAL